MHLIFSLLYDIKEYSIKYIAERSIEGEPEISSEPVHRDQTTAEKITGLSNEDKTINEGTVTYDIRFTVIIPDTKHTINRTMISLTAF